MKKLLISSTSFVSLMSTINFSSLRLDNSTQFLYTSSVIIGPEFVFSNLRLIVSEDLLPLSVQESPNLFAFRVCLLISWPYAWLMSRQTTGFTDLSWLIDDDDRPETGLLVRSDRLVLGMPCTASDRFRRRRDPRLRGTVARLRTPDWTWHKSLWGSSRWAHNLWRRTWRPGDTAPQRQCAWLLSTYLKESEEQKAVGSAGR